MANVNNTFRNAQHFFICVVESLFRLFIGVMFCVSGLQKIYLPYDFIGNVYLYEILGPQSGYLLALVLPWLELTIGIFLVGGYVLTGSWGITVVLLVIFVIGKYSVLLRGLTIPCGCFSVGGSTITQEDVFMTIALLLLALLGTLLTITKYRACRSN